MFLRETWVTSRGAQVAFRSLQVCIARPRPERQARGRCDRARPSALSVGSPGPPKVVHIAALTRKGRFTRLRKSAICRAEGRGFERGGGAGFPRPVPHGPIASASPFLGRPARPLTCSNPFCGGGGRGSLRPCRACALGFPDAAGPDRGGTGGRARSGSRSVGVAQWLRRRWRRRERWVRGGGCPELPSERGAPEGTGRAARGAASGAEALRRGGAAAGWMAS